VKFGCEILSVEPFRRLRYLRGISLPFPRTCRPYVGSASNDSALDSRNANSRALRASVSSTEVPDCIYQRHEEAYCDSMFGLVSRAGNIMK
jgi:hypothetical protein